MAQLQMNFRSALLRRAVNVSILLPTNSNPRGTPEALKDGMQYQVLWLLHGGMGDDRDYLNFSRIPRWADEHHIAVVMPACEKKFWEEPYFTYITEELPELLRKLLPLSPEREDNFIGGLSHGGDSAMLACLTYPDRYAAGLIMSAAGTTHDPLGNNCLLFDVFGPAQTALDRGIAPKLFFATGSGDRGAPFYLPIIHQLKDMGYPLHLHDIEGDGHSWDFWDNTLKLALEEWLPIRHDYIP